MLNTIFLFEGVDDATLDRIAPYFKTVRRVSAGTTLMTAADSTDDVFFLRSGKIRLSQLSESGEEIAYRDILAGDYFGWVSAIDGEARLKSATALEDSQITILTSAQFNEILFAHPRIHQNFMKRVAGVVRRYSERIEELTLLPARLRIMRELARRFEESSGAISIPSHEDLAGWTGTTRETVTRVLNALEEEQFIRRDHAQYYLLKAFDEI